jgi:glycosyltransferase involved in cell wall biosynthesis
MKPGLVIPICDHGDTIGAVVESLAKLDLPCIIVDDGSGEATRAELDLVEERHSWVRVLRHADNLGRGAALRTAYRAALARGLTHVVQIDADGQHDAGDVPRLLEAAAADPEALVLGEPIFDEFVPWHRLHGRKLSKAAVWLLTSSTAVRDPLCGFRCIPLAATVALIDRLPCGDRMDFDPALIIRLVRAGLPVANVPTAVCYPDGGYSNFRMLKDNALIAGVYLRLLLEPARRSRQAVKGRSE